MVHGQAIDSGSITTGAVLLSAKGLAAPSRSRQIAQAPYAGNAVELRPRDSRRVGIAHHPAALMVGNAHPTLNLNSTALPYAGTPTIPPAMLQLYSSIATTDTNKCFSPLSGSYRSDMDGISWPILCTYRASSARSLSLSSGFIRAQCCRTNTIQTALSPVRNTRVKRIKSHLQFHFEWAKRQKLGR